MPKGVKGTRGPPELSAKDAATKARKEMLDKANKEILEDRYPECKCAVPLRSGRFYDGLQACNRCLNLIPKVKRPKWL